MSAAAAPPVTPVEWKCAVRIIRSAYPPIDLFEDIADPADWPLLIAAEQKTNPRIMESIGNIDLVPPERRVAGAGASYLMAPFTHISADRPSRFSDGRYGVLYVADQFQTARFETIHHHARFMAATNERPGWTSQFREIILNISTRLHELRPGPHDSLALDPERYTASQALARTLRADGSNGIVYPSVRYPDGQCAGLFHPDCASLPVQGRHLDYHWNGNRVDLVREAGAGRVYQVVEI